MQPIYLDHNSTTPLDPAAAAAMLECQQAGFANPESQHQPGRRARQMLEDARDEIAAILRADLSGRTPDRLIFTSGGTEANNLALFGMIGPLAVAAGANERGLGSSPPVGRLVISAIEHPSVAQPAAALADAGWQIDRLPANSDGTVQVDSVDLLAKPPRLVSVMLANNETGVIQPVRRLAQVAASAGVPVHTDAAQAVGKIPVHFRDLGVAALSCAAHKFHGPRGIGALIVRGDVTLEPLLFGGFQQQGSRAGTEPVALAVGMATALRSFEREQVDRIERITKLRQQFEAAPSRAGPAR